MCPPDVPKSIGILLLLTARLCLGQTSVVVLNNSTQIVVAADSKVGTVGADNKIIDSRMCKILKHNGFFYTIGGPVIIKGPGFKSVFDAVRKASQNTTDIGAINRSFDRLIFAPLQRNISETYLKSPEMYQEDIQNRGGIALEIAFFQMKNKVPLVYGSRFNFTISGKTITLQRPEHVPPCVLHPELGTIACAVIVGQKEAIFRYMASHHWGSSLIEDARTFVGWR